MADSVVKYSKPIAQEETASLEEITFSSSNRSKTVNILAAAVVILTILVIIFVALFANEISRDGDCDSRSSGQTQGGASPVFTTTSPATTPTNKHDMDYGRGPWTNIRLPSYFMPHHYDLELVVNLDKLIFSGNVVVNVSLSKETPYMYLHSNKLNISNPKLWKDDKEMKLKRHFWYKKNQFYVMEAEKNLTAGIYVIKMNFVGKMEDDLVGLYRSTYRNKNGKVITIAVTQFQPTDARKTFPCFDEPALRATFSVTMVRAENMISLSNMPRLASEARGNGMVADYYQKTVTMPTYLLAFVVCDFGYLQDYAGKHNISMRYYTTNEQLDQAYFAREIGGEVLEYFEDYFNITYTLPKADMIAVRDFDAAGMENWGLIIYHESGLLVKNGQSSDDEKRRIFKVVAHELAHMWFGNLVTPAWWDDLWLSEGFASFMEYVAIEGLHPDENANDEFVNDVMQDAFTLDALVSSRPIVLPVNHPNEIKEIFDDISYKGAAIIRMLQFFLTKDVFTAGINNYLAAHAYGTAKTKQLWNYLTMASKAVGQQIDVAEVMDTWTLQMGFPVVNVAEVNGGIVLTQQRFLSNPNANQNDSKFTSKYGYKWNIPFTIKVGSIKYNTVVETTGLELVWMNRTIDKTIVTNTTWDPNTQWVIGNIGRTGYYRVNYPRMNWELLAEQLQYNYSVFSAGDRAGLIHDAFAFARSGMLEYKYALNLARYLEHEHDDIPLAAGHSSFSSLTTTLPKSGRTYKKMQEYILKLSIPDYDKLGANDTKEEMGTILDDDACSLRKELCLSTTKELFDNWMRNESYPLPASLRGVVYHYGISQSGENEWDEAFVRFQKTNVASERQNLIHGLAGSREPWILNRYLQYAFDKEKFNSIDMLDAITAVANRNPVGRYFAWNYVREMWPTIIRRYGDGFSFIAKDLLSGLVSTFSTRWELEELQHFFKKFPQSGTAAHYRVQLLERVRANIQWRAKYEKLVEEWLNSV